jgi:hypothetical protein
MSQRRQRHLRLRAPRRFRRHVARPAGGAVCTRCGAGTCCRRVRALARPRRRLFRASAGLACPVRARRPAPFQSASGITVSQIATELRRAPAAGVQPRLAVPHQRLGQPHQATTDSGGSRTTTPASPWRRSARQRRRASSPDTRRRPTLVASVVADRDLGPGLPQIELADLAGPIDRALERSWRRREQRADHAQVVIDDRLATIKTNRREEFDASTWLPDARTRRALRGAARPRWRPAAREPSEGRRAGRALGTGRALRASRSLGILRATSDVSSPWQSTARSATMAPRRPPRNPVTTSTTGCALTTSPTPQPRSP